MTPGDLAGAIRYEFAATISTCSRCHTHSARGSGVCAICRRDELARQVGEQLAHERYEVVWHERQLRNQIEDL